MEKNSFDGYFVLSFRVVEAISGCSFKIPHKFVTEYFILFYRLYCNLIFLNHSLCILWIVSCGCIYVWIYDFNKIFCRSCNVKKMSQYTIIDKKIHFLCEYRTAQETQTTKYVFWMAENELEIKSDLMKNNAFFELRMNRSEIKLLSTVVRKSSLYFVV